MDAPFPEIYKFSRIYEELKQVCRVPLRLVRFNPKDVSFCCKMCLRSPETEYEVNSLASLILLLFSRTFFGDRSDLSTMVLPD